MKSFYDKHVGKASPIGRGATKVTKFAGGANLSKYAGETIARRKNKSIKRTVTGKQALRSAGGVGLTVSGIGGLGRAVAVKVATRSAAKASAKSSAKANSRWLRDAAMPAHAKRRRSYEGLARKAAKRRAKNK